MSDADYFSAGKASNQSDYRATPEPLVLCLLHEEEGFGWLMDVPFALKQLIDVHAVMRHAVAVAGEREEPLTHHSLFHPSFAAFGLGFCQGLVAAHRRKHLRWHGEAPELSPLQREQCETWGVEMATYYLAAVENYGVFGKVTDVELYGIVDRWWMLAEPRRLNELDLRHCVDGGRAAAAEWSEDESADVPALFAAALQRVYQENPDRRFETLVSGL